jgi:hypothetical protein
MLMPPTGAPVLPEGPSPRPVGLGGHRCNRGVLCTAGTQRLANEASELEIDA